MEAIEVRCPQCDAHPGQPCYSRTRPGRLLAGGKRSHGDREHYAETGEMPFRMWLRVQLQACRDKVGQ